MDICPVHLEDVFDPSRTDLFTEFYFIFIFPSDLKDEIVRIEGEMMTEMTTQYLLPFLFIVVLIGILGSLYLNHLSKSITRPIVELLEKLKPLNDALKEGRSIKDILSSYKDRNKEINELHIGFS